MFTVHASGLASDCGYLSVHKMCTFANTQTPRVFAREGLRRQKWRKFAKEEKKKNQKLEGINSGLVLRRQ